MKSFEAYVDNLRRKTDKIRNDKILFVCIGTSTILWDSIGPLVGSYLKEKIGTDKVLGDINHNICSEVDLLYYYPKIKNKFVIAIDTALTAQELFGEIFISNSPTVMGLALSKNRGIVGDISIKAALSNSVHIDEKYIISFAEFIGRGICELVDPKDPKEHVPFGIGMG